ncbi:MAG: hypothetical protein JXA03_14745 [Bacteroidales bacterium]|nr:hypothetical protein [Bacteroidales bacterium]
MNKPIVFLLSAGVIFHCMINAQESKPKGFSGLPKLSVSDSLELTSMPMLPVPVQYSGPQAPVLPPAVDNSENLFWRPVFNQVGYECGQASGIGQNFTYQINRLRNLPSNVPENQYPTHFCWNFGNGGDGYYGVSYFHSFEIIRTLGTPNVVEYGGSMSSGGPKRWMSGYDEYYSGMHNRIYEAYQIDVSNEEGVMILKHWIHDHLEGSATGGVASFYAACPWGMPTLPAGTPEAGKYVMLEWGASANHAMCIAGYNDSIRWDYNSDGQYTNHIDINNDGKVDVRDWEIGGLKFSNNYGGGPSWGNNGFCYMMYKTLADAYGSGGIWNNAAHVLYAKENTEPLLTAKVVLKHVCRKMIRIKAGISMDTLASLPDYEMNLPVFHFQGGCYYMQGGATEEDKTIEFGLDLSPLLNRINSGSSARFFLIVDEDDPANSAQGEITSYSIIDYTGSQPVEVKYGEMNIPLVNNGTTTIGINRTMNFDTVYITTETLPDATVYEPYSFQLSAGGGQGPYIWDLDLNYSETGSIQAFPNVTAEQLNPTNNNDGYAVKNLGFSFPFYDGEYSQVKVYVDGYILVNNLLSWPYQVYDFLLFTKNRNIAPFYSDLRLYPSSGDGMWYEGNEEYAIFRWNASVNDQAAMSDLNFAVKIDKYGSITLYYGETNSYSGIDWISGLSYGNNKYYQLTEVSGNPAIPGNYAIYLQPSFPPEGFMITHDGVFSGIATQIFDNFPVKIMVTDRDNMTNSKTLLLSTDGTNFLVIKETSVSSGGDGVIEFGETASLSVTIENLGSQLITGAFMAVSVDDPYITLIDSAQFLGNFEPGKVATFNDAFIFQVSNFIPDNHDFVLNTIIVDNGGGEWLSHIYLTGYAPVVAVQEVAVDDGGNGILDPGETSDINVVLKNNGGADADNVEALLSGNNAYITVNAGTAYAPELPASGTHTMTFNITASPGLPVGYITDFTVEVEADNEYSSSDMFFLVSGFEMEDFESGGFLSYPWSFGGEAPWEITDAEVYEGTYSSVSGPVGDNQSSALNLQACFLGGGEVSFYRKVSSEDTYDFLNFYVDGSLRGSWSGEHDWELVSYQVPQGIHTLSWAYEKDVSIANGSDCGWVDYISFPAFGDMNPALDHSPGAFDVTLEEGGMYKDTLYLSNSGMNPLVYELEVEEQMKEALWLSVSPKSGGLNPSETDKAVVSFDATSLETGDYYGSIFIRDHAGNEYPVDVHLTVTPLVSINADFSEGTGLTVAPNPFRGNAAIEFNLSANALVSLEVSGLSGNSREYLLKDRPLNGGKHRFIWNNSGKSGIYLIRLTVNGRLLAVKKAVSVY